MSTPASGGIIMFKPPLDIQYDLLDRALDVLDEVLGELEAGEVAEPPAAARRPRRRRQPGASRARPTTLHR